MIFTEIAYAQSAPAASQGGVLMTILPLLIMIGVFYFLVMRPQITREKKRQQMQASLKRGEKVITSGGFIAKVSKLEDEQYILVTLTQGVDVRMSRSHIEGVVEVDIPTAPKSDQKTPKAASAKKPTSKTPRQQGEKKTSTTKKS